jgi:hypothetical protein
LGHFLFAILLAVFKPSKKILMKKVLFFFVTLFFAIRVEAQTIGLFQNSPESYNGYTLFSSIFGTTTYLIDNCGKQVHSWQGNFPYVRTSVYLLPDGSLLRSGSDTGNSSFGSSAAGAFEKIDWNGNVTWRFSIADSIQSAHHDFTVMPNGNILAAVWEYRTITELIANGRNPDSVATLFWPDKIVEIEPTGIDSAVVVWEWKAWDHLIQDFSPSAANYGIVQEHPELIDINLVPKATNSWMHVNSVDYNADLDQIILSARNFNEFMIIDHSTTTAEAAGHTGGKRGRGGDLLYRWGNPVNYRRGTIADRRLFQQHDAKWIQAGLPSGGKVMVFNNGNGRPAGAYSTVEIIEPPLLPDSTYDIVVNQPFGPPSSEWTYPTLPDTTFYSATMGGASMQPNGNVLICEASTGELVEVDSSGNIVWKYVSPLHPTGVLTQGSTGGNKGVFKISRYSPDYTGFAGQTLTPGLPIEINPLPYSCTIYTIDGIEDLPSLGKANFAVSPNPVKAIVTISLTTAKAAKWNFQLLDLEGRMLMESNHMVRQGQNEVQMNLSPYSGGCYLLQATSSIEKLHQMIVIH